MSANPNAGFRATSIPKQHMPHVLNSLLCEKCLGFERRLNDAGKFEWRGQKADGWSEWSEALVDFSGDLAEAQRLLQRICQQASVGYNLIYDPRTRKHAVYMLGIDEAGAPVPIIRIEGATRLPEAIAAAMCGYLNLDVPGQHKVLYPGNYLLLSS